MSQPEQFEVLILGSGQGGELLAWHMARSGRRTAVVERRWIGGSCPNIACLPSKNEIWSARVAHLVRHAAQFGTAAGPVATDMAKVRQRKRDMVNREIDFHLQEYKTTGAELIMGTGRFVAPKTLEVRLNDGGTRELAGDQLFLNIGTHAAIPSVPGLEAARPLTHIEALELDYLPPHLIVLGGGYVGLELAQAYLRFGSRVTVIQSGPQLMTREDPDDWRRIPLLLRNIDMQLTDFKVLTFDCYGTLIDWESGMTDAYRGLVARSSKSLARDQILETHARYEADQEAKTPAIPYSAGGSVRFLIAANAFKRDRITRNAAMDDRAMRAISRNTPSQSDNRFQPFRARGGSRGTGNCREEG
jgi:cation diffusion facilitator CzcD-associated flavoprotein CzcO